MIQVGPIVNKIAFRRVTLLLLHGIGTGTGGI